MSKHTGLPMILGIDRSILRFRPNSRWIEQNFCSHQAHYSSRFWIPLIPADTYANLGITSVPYLKASISRIKVELLFITWAIWNMTLAVFTKHRSISIDYSK
ncbi:hypothetical protein D3C75_988940 [compost metagenome]